MEYKIETEINAPIEKVADLLADHGQMEKWIKEFDSYERISGEPKQPGTITKIRLDIGPGIDATETLERVEFPHSFGIRYDVKDVVLAIEIDLKVTSENSTLYSINHKFKFSGPLKLAAGLMKPAFKKRSEEMVEQFKRVAEE